MNFDNTVRDAQNKIVGFRCSQCDEIKSRMWGTLCNRCRFANDLAHEMRMIRELAIARQQASDQYHD